MYGGGDWLTQKIKQNKKANLVVLQNQVGAKHNREEFQRPPLSRCEPTPWPLRLPKYALLDLTRPWHTIIQLIKFKRQLYYISSNACFMCCISYPAYVRIALELLLARVQDRLPGSNWVDFFALPIPSKILILLHK